jgi:hypothetical protein
VPTLLLNLRQNDRSPPRPDTSGSTNGSYDEAQD